MCTIVAVRSADLYLPPGSRTENLGSRDFIHSWWDRLKNFHRAECIKSLTVIHDGYTMFSPLMADPVDAAVTQQWCHRFFRWSSHGHAVQSSPGPSKYQHAHAQCCKWPQLLHSHCLQNVGWESLNTTSCLKLLFLYRWLRAIFCPSKFSIKVTNSYMGISSHGDRHNNEEQEGGWR